MVCVRMLRVDAHRDRKGDDRSYAVLTLRDGRTVALRDAMTETRHAHWFGLSESGRVGVGSGQVVVYAVGCGRGVRVGRGGSGPVSG
jgi:hypothetical protein